MPYKDKGHTQNLKRDDRTRQNESKTDRRNLRSGDRGTNLRS